MTRSLGFGLLLWFLVTSPVLAQKAKQNKKGASNEDPWAQAVTETYRTFGEVELKIYIFNPADHKPSDKKPAIVFFFGGGWKGGDPKQFAEHCKYLAGRGMVAMTAEYRVSSRHGVKAVSCVEDAKSAIRWVRVNASHLGVDPDKVVAGGGSAGGHLAACTGVVPGYENSQTSAGTSSVPNALVLFNPALVLASVPGEPTVAESKLADLRERVGDDPIKVSPYHQVQKGAPPTIIFHGKADTTVPYRTAELFTEAMTKVGNRCELKGYEGKQHGFFNFGRDGNTSYHETVKEMDAFLVSVGFLSPVEAKEEPGEKKE